MGEHTFKIQINELVQPSRQTPEDLVYYSSAHVNIREENE